MAEIDSEGQETTGLEDYLKVLRERWWVIVLSVVIVTGAAFYVSVTTTPLYSASSTLVYQKNSLDTALLGTQLFANDYDPTRTIQTAVAVIGSNESISEGVKKQLGSSKDAGEFAGMVSVATDPGTNMVTISAVSHDPNEAAAVASAFADQFIIYRQNADRATVATARDVVKQQLDTLSPTDLQGQYGLMLQEKYETLRILEAMQDGGFRLVSRAVVPGAAFTPQTRRNIFLGLVVGLVLGVGLAFLLDYLDKRIKDEKTLENEIGAPVLVSVPSVGGRWRHEKNGERSDRPIGFSTHQSLLEPFRTLRSSLQYFSLENKIPVWLITSGLPQEGKTVTSVNLALSFALSGKRVILVEADLRRPMVHEYLGVDRGPGLSDVLAGTKKVLDALQLVKADEFLPSAGRRQPGEENPKLLQRNLYVMTSGPLPPNPAELLASERMGKVVQELAGITDVLIIDTPPVLMVSDALVLAQHVDGVILAARLRSTTRDEAREVRSVLERAGVRVIGVVAGGIKGSPAYYRKRGYGGNDYRHGYSAGEVD